MAEKMQPALFEDCKILFRNFSGKEGKFNAEGDRNFSLILNEEQADAMARDGWNVKYLKPREEGDEPTPRIEVSVEFRKGRPPKVYMITHAGKTLLEEDMLSILDWVQLKNVDLIIRPYNWNVSGRSGVKAYLQTAYITIHEDAEEIALQDKYDEVPDSAKGSLKVLEERSDETPF